MISLRKLLWSVSLMLIVMHLSIASWWVLIVLPEMNSPHIREPCVDEVRITLIVFPNSTARVIHELIGAPPGEIEVPLLSFKEVPLITPLAIETYSTVSLVKEDVHVSVITGNQTNTFRIDTSVEEEVKLLLRSEAKIAIAYSVRNLLDDYPLLKSCSFRLRLPNLAIRRLQLESVFALVDPGVGKAPHLFFTGSLCLRSGRRSMVLKPSMISMEEGSVLVRFPDIYNVDASSLLHIELDRSFIPSGGVVNAGMLVLAMNIVAVMLVIEFFIRPMATLVVIPVGRELRKHYRPLSGFGLGLFLTFIAMSFIETISLQLYWATYYPRMFLVNVFEALLFFIFSFYVFIILFFYPVVALFSRITPPELAMSPGFLMRKIDLWIEHRPFRAITITYFLFSWQLLIGLCVRAWVNGCITIWVSYYLSPWYIATALASLLISAASMGFAVGIFCRIEAIIHTQASGSPVDEVIRNTVEQMLRSRGGRAEALLQRTGLLCTPEEMEALAIFVLNRMVRLGELSIHEGRVCRRKGPRPMAKV